MFLESRQTSFRKTVAVSAVCHCDSATKCETGANRSVRRAQPFRLERSRRGTVSTAVDIEGVMLKILSLKQRQWTVTSV